MCLGSFAVHLGGAIVVGCWCLPAKVGRGVQQPYSPTARQGKPLATGPLHTQAFLGRKACPGTSMASARPSEPWLTHAGRGMVLVDPMATRTVERSVSQSAQWACKSASSHLQKVLMRCAVESRWNLAGAAWAPALV